ncbi:3'-5' exonuclease [Demequina sediminicola]|uniref:3'-5' exonuclease n=1 Tax=Demequina sediminicola TaxID=1095026 RepID=UPI00078254A8|nr:3'-5' exonuclease [Demequina sediminicola]
MTTLVWANKQQKLDKAVKAKVYDFLDKLQTNDALPGLHIEPMQKPVDARVRTGRVDQQWRAVLFKVPQKDDVAYFYMGTWNHDEAIDLARKMTISVNPVGGFTEVSYVEEPETDDEDVVVEPTDTADTLSLLESWGYTLEHLTDQLGLARATARAAAAAPDEEALLEVAVRVGGWQGEALGYLVDGLSIEDIREKFGLNTPVEQDADATEDEKILRGLEHPTAQAAFAYIEGQEELQRVIEAQDFGAWRVFLHPEQRKYATAHYNGAFRLSGGAGTGKTVVLVHRARNLWRENPQARVVLTTYTRNLADMLRANLQQLDPGVPIASKLGAPGVYITNIDALVSQVLKEAGTEISTAAQQVLGRPATHVTSRPDGDTWETAISAAGDGLPDNLRSPSFFAAEYAMVVLPRRVVSRAGYFSASRAGRGVALNRALRSKVWSVIDAYRASGKVFSKVDWEESVAIAAEHLTLSSMSGHLADHVLVDEGQDLTPVRWQLLRALVAEGPDDLFIAEDSHQRIYGQRVVLGQYGIRIVGRSQRLTLNYRTTEQNLEWAVGVLSGADFSDVEGDAATVAGYHSARSGPSPALVPCNNDAAEFDEIAARIRGWLEAKDVEPEAIAVLVRSNRQAARVVSALGERGVDARSIDGHAKIGTGTPVVLTMHRAKGTEFSKVVLAGVAEGAVPAAVGSEKYDADAYEDAMLRERSLLYVAATRARDELVVTWSGTRSDLIGAKS